MAFFAPASAVDTSVACDFSIRKTPFADRLLLAARYSSGHLAPYDDLKETAATTATGEPEAAAAAAAAVNAKMAAGIHSEVASMLQHHDDATPVNLTVNKPTPSDSSSNGFVSAVRDMGSGNVGEERATPNAMEEQTAQEEEEGDRVMPERNGEEEQGEAGKGRLEIDADEEYVDVGHHVREAPFGNIRPIEYADPYGNDEIVDEPEDDENHESPVNDVGMEKKTDDDNDDNEDDNVEKATLEVIRKKRRLMPLQPSSSSSSSFSRKRKLMTTAAGMTATTSATTSAVMKTTLTTNNNNNVDNGCRNGFSVDRLLGLKKT